MIALRGGLCSALPPLATARTTTELFGAAALLTSHTLRRPRPPQLARCSSERAFSSSRICCSSWRAIGSSPSSRRKTAQYWAAIRPPQSSTPHARRSIFGSRIITHYVDLPPDYDDAEGLPFRRRDLDRQEVSAIFGPGISAAAANQLLRILHGRRVAGTLDDPVYRVNTSHYPVAEIKTALAYLRVNVPVDELINAGLRAEDELAAMEEQVADREEGEGEEGEAAQEEERGDGRAKKAALKKLNESKWRARLFREETKESPEKGGGGDVYGVGAFDAIRARNRARFEVRERERQAAEAARRAAQEKEWREKGAKVRDVVELDGSRTTVPLTRDMSPRMQQYALAAQSPLQEPPKMTRWQRLWPSYLFAAVVLAGGALLASTYRAPPPTDRLVFPASVPPAAATVWALIAANVAVFVLWRVPPLWRIMNRYFIVVPATPHPLSLIGAMFSHQKPGHLLMNMVFLWFVGTRLHDEIGGRAQFVQAYGTAGLLGGLASLTYIVLRGRLHLTTLGASGAINGVATAYFVLHKFDGFKILGLPPDPYTGIQGLGFAGLLLGLNLLGVLSRAGAALDHANHFAGMATGAAFGEYYYRQRKSKEPKPAAEVLLPGLAVPPQEKPEDGGDGSVSSSRGNGPSP